MLFTQGNSPLNQFFLIVVPHLIFLVLLGYAQIPRDERICEECNKCEMEDELHFLFKCDKYIG